MQFNVSNLLTTKRLKFERTSREQAVGSSRVIPNNFVDLGNVLADIKLVRKDVYTN